jgi:hypothetical protein
MKRWVWYIIAAVVFALAGGGVLYGVLTHKESGLMLVCWEGGIANYNKNCEELKWKKGQMPLPYYIDFGADHKVYVDSVIEAADMWNKEIAPVFKRVDKKENAVVVVSWGAYDSNNSNDCAAGYVKHRGYGGPKSAELVLRNPSDVHAVMRYAAHEFGHVLGLAHDEHGIMKPKLEDVTTELKFTLPTDHDKKLLRGLYR